MILLMSCCYADVMLTLLTLIIKVQIYLNRRFTTFLAPKALQQLQRRSETSERTLCRFSKDVSERPNALKVLRNRIFLIYWNTIMMSETLPIIFSRFTGKSICDMFGTISNRIIMYGKFAKFRMLTKYRILASLHNAEPLCGLWPH